MSEATHPKSSKVLAERPRVLAPEINAAFHQLGCCGRKTEQRLTRSWADHSCVSEPVEMLLDQKTHTIREAVGVFSRSDDLQDAIDELLSSGFDRAELSLLAGEQAIEKKLGHRVDKFDGLADDPVTPRTAYVSTEAIGDAQGGLIGGLVSIGGMAAGGAVVASGGTLAAVIAAAAAAGGAGGLIGAILARLIGDHHAHHLQAQLDRGGLLLWVRTWDDEDERTAVQILKKHSGGDVHVHALPARA